MLSATVVKFCSVKEERHGRIRKNLYLCIYQSRKMAGLMARKSPCHTYFCVSKQCFPELESGKFKKTDIKETGVLYAYTAFKPKRNTCDIGVASVSRCQAFSGALVQDTLSHTFMYKDIKNIHIGELIDARIRECGMSYAEFARHLCLERTTVYNIVRSKSIDIERLIRISDILGYDFLRNVYMSPIEHATPAMNIEINGKEIYTDGAESCEIRISVKPSKVD